MTVIKLKLNNNICPSQQNYQNDVTTKFDHNIQQKSQWVSNMRKQNINGPHPYINILTWHRAFRVKILNLLCLLCHSIPKRDFDTNQLILNIEVGPESLRTMLHVEY